MNHFDVLRTSSLYIELVANIVLRTSSLYIELVANIKNSSFISCDFIWSISYNAINGCASYEKLKCTGDFYFKWMYSLLHVSIMTVLDWCILVLKFTISKFLIHVFIGVWQANTLFQLTECNRQHTSCSLVIVVCFTSNYWCKFCVINKRGSPIRKIIGNLCILHAFHSRL